ncbi:MAG: DNA cytosine methyltransferase [Clostridia bacterium]|nr:DNA cytosine methyltransferase [Clostridia bacterium]
MILVQSSYVGTYQYAKSDNFMKGKERLQKGKEIADTLQTNGKEGVVVYEPNLKQELCNTLIEKGLVKENDVIRHSYTHNRLDNGIENMGRVQSKDNNIMPTLDTRSDCFGIVVKELIPYGSYYTWKDNQGNINTQCNRAVDENGVALTVACAETGKVLTNNLRIRKLTPRECMRLMGVKDSDSCKIKQSDASIYHLAGDSIVTTCLMAIFGELLGIDYKAKIEELVEQIKN